MSNIEFTPPAWEDYLYWQSANRKIFDRINSLIKECSRTPHTGTGKPEPLKGNLATYWSRRITETDRMVYKITDDNTLLIMQLRYHY